MRSARNSPDRSAGVRKVEGRVEQGTAPYQHFGVAADLISLAGNYWAIFSPRDISNTLFARVKITCPTWSRLATITSASGATTVSGSLLFCPSSIVGREPSIGRYSVYVGTRAVIRQKTPNRDGGTDRHGSCGRAGRLDRIMHRPKPGAAPATFEEAPRLMFFRDRDQF
jgi:hypothetical protein